MQQEKSILIIGAGRAGIRMLEKAMTSDIPNVEYLAIDRDEEDLKKALIPKKICISKNQMSNLFNDSMIQPELSHANKVFVLAGLGGQCGTSATVAIAKIAHSLGIPSYYIVTEPFSFEGRKRQEIAKTAINELSQYGHTLTIHVDGYMDPKLTFRDVFSVIDNIVVQNITDNLN